MATYTANLASNVVVNSVFTVTQKFAENSDVIRANTDNNPSTSNSNTDTNNDGLYVAFNHVTSFITIEKLVDYTPSVLIEPIVEFSISGILKALNYITFPIEELDTRYYFSDTEVKVIVPINVVLNTSTSVNAIFDMKYIDGNENTSLVPRIYNEPLYINNVLKDVIVKLIVPINASINMSMGVNSLFDLIFYNTIKLAGNYYNFNHGVTIEGRTRQYFETGDYTYLSSVLAGQECVPGLNNYLQEDDLGYYLINGANQKQYISPFTLSTYDRDYVGNVQSVFDSYYNDGVLTYAKYSSSNLQKIYQINVR